MLRITVELVPGGVEKNKSVLATGIIVNDGSGSAIAGNYDAAFTTKRGTRLGSRVYNYPRLNPNLWALVELALHNAVPSETPE